MPAAAVAAIGADIAAALAALQAAGLVHRDVKPSNILLDGGGRARLGDFGIARAEEIDGLEDATATGGVVGTLRFLPPEVLAGEPVTAASDVWALGAVLHEALTGSPPFDASSPAALLASQRARPARAAPPGDALGDELAAMLDPVPSSRPSAAAVAMALRETASPADPGEDATVVIPALSRPVAVPVRPVPDRARVSPSPLAAAARQGIVPAGVLVALLLAAGLLVAVNGPFASSSDPGGTAPSVPSGVSPAPAVAASPAGSAGPSLATPVRGNKGKGHGSDKPGKPGKGNGG